MIQHSTPGSSGWVQHKFIHPAASHLRDNLYLQDNTESEEGCRSGFMYRIRRIVSRQAVTVYKMLHDTMIHSTSSTGPYTYCNRIKTTTGTGRLAAGAHVKIEQRRHLLLGSHICAEINRKSLSCLAIWHYYLNPGAASIYLSEKLATKRMFITRLKATNGFQKDNFPVQC